MSHDEMIAVIAAHRDGKAIECKGESNVWNDVVCMSWDFKRYAYRIKPEPRVMYWNECADLHPGQGYLRLHGPYGRIEDADAMAKPDRIRVVKFVEVLE